MCLVFGAWSDLHLGCEILNCRCFLFPVVTAVFFRHMILAAEAFYGGEKTVKKNKILSVFLLVLTAVLIAFFVMQKGLAFTLPLVFVVVVVFFMRSLYRAFLLVRWEEDDRWREHP